jgi:hypothetical protein
MKVIIIDGVTDGASAPVGRQGGNHLGRARPVCFLSKLQAAMTGRNDMRTSQIPLILSVALCAVAFESSTALHAPGMAADDEKAKAAALAKATLNPIACLISLPLQDNFE